MRIKLLRKAPSACPASHLRNLSGIIALAKSREEQHIYVTPNLVVITQQVVQYANLQRLRKEKKQTVTCKLFLSPYPDV